MSKKILLVEDDPIARKAMDALITRHPLLAPHDPIVVHAASGQQGLAVFVAEQPDMIVTDLFMPAMDGFALCRAIREAPFGKEIPILVISGIYKDPTLEDSLREEVQARFLPKPLPPDQLAQTILECLGLVSTSSASSSASMSVFTAPTVVASQFHNLNAASTAEMPILAETLASLPPPPTAPNLPPAPSAPARLAKEGTWRGLPATAGPAPARSGSLEQTHVARLIFDLADGEATGTLSLNHGKVKKDLYFRKGEVVAADSNLRQEALGNLLCGKGIIDESQLAYLLTETKARGHKMGAVLVELGWMTPEEVLEALAAQARKRLVDCIRWDAGEYTFVPGDSFGERVLEHKLEMTRTIFLGLYRSATPEALVRRFDQSGDQPVELTQRFDRYRAEVEALFGRDTSLLLAKAPTIGTLALREDANIVLAAVDAMIETGLAQLGYAEPGGMVANVADAMESSISLERLGMEIANRFDAIVLPDLNLGFEDAAQASPAALPVFTPAMAPMEDADSGAIDIGFAPNQNAWNTNDSSAPATVVTPGEGVRAALLHDFLLLHGKSFYDLLGVDAAATTAEILTAVQNKLAPYAEEALAGLTLAPDDQTKLQAVRATFQQAGRTLSDPAERAAYDASLRGAHQVEVDPFGAELAFGEAIQHMQASEFDKAITRFQDAVAARPDQGLYHAYLAFAEFSARPAGDFAPLHERLDHALSLDPDLAEAHAIYGRVLAAQGDYPGARGHLERSLALSPAQPETIDFLLESYTQEPLPDPRNGERFIKQLVLALGNRLEAVRHRLWLALARLYEEKLGDREAARIAYDTAARLGPGDLPTLRKSAEYSANDPSRWKETVRSLAAEWQHHPTDATLPARLFESFQRQGMDDGCLVVATAMVLRGVATPREEQLAEEGRPSALQRLAGRLPPDLHARLGYRAEDRDLEDLLAVLTEAGVVEPFSAEDAGLSQGEVAIDEARPSASFRRVLRYASELLKTPPPAQIYELPVLALDARMAHLATPSLLCGSGLLDSGDTVELGFRLTRALTLASPGRLAAACRTGGQLRPYFADALALSRSAVPAPGTPSPLQALAPELRERVVEQARRLARQNKKLNLSVWVRSLARLATRMSLLACGDILRVGRAIAEEEGPEALDELILFALSPEHLDLRRDLGIGNV